MAYEQQEGRLKSILGILRASKRRAANAPNHGGVPVDHAIQRGTIVVPGEKR